MSDFPTTFLKFSTIDIFRPFSNPKVARELLAPNLRDCPHDCQRAVGSLG